MKYLAKQLTPPALRPFIKSLFARTYLTNPKLARAAIGEVTEEMRARIDDVLACPDNQYIPRAPKAGVLDGYRITMHNGVKVCAHGYFGAGALNMLLETGGVHEPQEERAFERLITWLPERPVMLELGACWAYYSLSLLQARPLASCYMVEPDRFNMVAGKLNFKINGRKGHFTRAWVDEHPKRNPRTISIDSFCAEHAIERLHILHSDIQGFELPMLKGAQAMLSQQRVDYVFISSHSNALHEACRAELVKHRYVILASANLDESYSVDGILVAKREALPTPEPIEISLKPPRKSAF
ncbi:MAG: FkbM family methyltransferase [Verrucomicrobia bacterium]|nr:FkbM family methyltransferase [Verrucomicrobiota bacterium]